MPTSPPIIVYHADCIDGAASAWIIAKALGVEDAVAKDAAVFIPYRHNDGQTGEDAVRAALKTGSDVYFADVTPEKPFLDELLKSGKEVHVLDHHTSAAETLDGRTEANLHTRFNPAAPSAAKMIWSHFFPSQEPPAVIELIDLMDGAANGLSTPEEFAAAALVDAQNIRTHQDAFAALRGLAKLEFNDMAQKGGSINAKHTQLIDRLFEKASAVHLQLLPGGKAFDVPIVNGNLKQYGRRISARLVDLGKDNGAPAAFMWSLQKNGAVSLYIRTDGTTDASEIAKHLCKTTGATGGGHKDAAAVHFASILDFARHVPMKALKQARQTRREPPSPS